MLALSPRITSRHGQLCRRIQGQHRANIRNLHTSQMIPSTFPGWNPTHSILHGSDEYQPPTNHQPGFSSHSSNMGMDRNHPMDEGLVFRILLKSINAIWTRKATGNSEFSRELGSLVVPHMVCAPNRTLQHLCARGKNYANMSCIYIYERYTVCVYIYINIYV